MKPQAQPVEGQAYRDADNAGVASCPNCRAAMPGQMRFCRLCGYRLGEGVAEFAETVRLQEPHTAPRQARTGQSNYNAGAAPRPGPMPGAFYDLNPLAHRGGNGSGAARQSTEQSRTACGRMRRLRRSGWPHWFIWPIIGITMSVAATGGQRMGDFARQIPEVRVGPNIHLPAQPAMPPLPPLPDTPEESSLGTNELTDAVGGASFDYVTPDSAADKAGLVGGDIITGFDGHSIKSSDELTEVLGRTPVGKTVEVVFIRDGKTKTAKLTTISEGEKDRLDELLEGRGEGQGFIGEGEDLERVHVPGINIDGVRLGEIEKNNPADIAGLRNGDIVIELDGVPIRTRREFESRIERAQPGSTIKTVAIRNGTRIEVPVKVGQGE